MKVLITGAGGQLAYELARTAPEDVEYRALARADLDISNKDAVEALINGYQPDAVINAAAYTAVDKAESESDTAFSVNEQGVENLAFACAKLDCYFLHVSTDFVFDGRANRPYTPDDLPAPVNVYGHSKLAGEQAVYAKKPKQSAIIRTAWVYSSHGKNFVKSLLHYMAERPELNIVVDQLGTPTWAYGLAEVCWQAVGARIEGTYHWSDAGVASWYDFTEAIQLLGVENGLIESERCVLNAIPTEDYPTPATRPVYTVLDKRKTLEALPGIKNVHWQKQLGLMIKELTELRK